MKCAQARLSVGPFLKKKRFFIRGLANWLAQKWMQKAIGAKMEEILTKLRSSTRGFVTNRENSEKKRRKGYPCNRYSGCPASTAILCHDKSSFIHYPTSNQEFCVKSRILRQIKNFASSSLIKEARLPRNTAVGAGHRLWRLRGPLSLFSPKTEKTEFFLFCIKSRRSTQSSGDLEGEIFKQIFSKN